jgi:hypothetical protein
MLFMEPEGSLPHPQQPTTGPCPKPDESYHENQSDILKFIMKGGQTIKWTQKHMHVISLPFLVA